MAGKDENPEERTAQDTKTIAGPATPVSEVRKGELTDEALGRVSGGTAVSNVLKTRHDTVKNSISNIR
jgi:hypothetical protein